MSTNTLYAALGLEPTASAEEIEAAYRVREQALQGQPDALSLLRVAYDTLRSPDQRAAYDRRLAVQQPFAPTPVIYELDAPHATHRRSRALNWLVLLLAAGGTIGYFWFKAPAIAPRKATTSSAIAAAEQASPPALTVPAEPAPTPASIDVTPPAISTPSSAASAPIPDLPPPPPATPTRKAKQPGFDSEYVAWSVFTIRQRNKMGSGVLIGPDRILTNCHVLAGGATDGLVAIHSLTKQVAKVEKYARLDGEDACLLYAPGAGNDSIAWGSSAALKPGDALHAMGHPGGSRDILWSQGTFEMRTERGGETFLLADIYCRPGSSGGPMLDGEGRLVGIVTAGQRFKSKAGEPPQYGACIAVTESTARALLSKPLFPIALAPAQYIPNY